MEFELVLALQEHQKNFRNFEKKEKKNVRNQTIEAKQYLGSESTRT